MEYQPKFGIQIGFPIPIGIDLGECGFYWLENLWYKTFGIKLFDKADIALAQLSARLLLLYINLYSHGEGRDLTE